MIMMMMMMMMMMVSRIESCLFYEVNTGKCRSVKKTMAEVWLTIRRKSAAIWNEEIH